MLNYCAILTVVSFAVFDANALACEHHKHETTPFNLKNADKIYFQPTRPDHPVDGEVWITAQNGEQFIFQNGSWISRNLHMILSALKSDH